MSWSFLREWDWGCYVQRWQQVTASGVIHMWIRTPSTALLHALCSQRSNYSTPRNSRTQLLNHLTRGCLKTSRSVP